ncbi:MAG TPA: HAD-IIIA family hydrolase [Gemmatimonadales bacterium]
MKTPRAVFLDRDGTLIEDSGYIRDARAMRLFPGAAEAVARLNRAGWLPVVVTNQSGIARGLVTQSEYLATERRLEELLAPAGAKIAAQYHCPHLPELTGECDCRKPGPLLYKRAAERFGLDLAASYWIGDQVRDLEGARQFGGDGILVLTGAGRKEAAAAEVAGWQVAADIAAAVGLLLDI